MKITRLFSVLALAALGFALATPAFAAPQQRPENVMKALKANKDLSKFTDMIEAAGLSDDLSSKDLRFTIFAPSNAAVDKLASDVMKRAKADKDGVKKLVEYHIIKGSVVSETNIKGRRAGPSTMNGEMIGFDGTGKELKINDAVITQPDQITMNGVVHTISGVLVPESLKDPKIKEEARMKEEEAMRKQMEAQEAEREKEMKAREAEMQKNAPKAEPAKAAAPAAPKVEEKAKDAATTAPASPASTEAAPAAKAEEAPVAVPAAPKEEKKGFLKKLFGG